MSVSEKTKAINNKIEQNRAQYDLHRQTAKISALSSRNASKYEFLTSKHVLPEKDLLEKAATMKRFEYSALGKELKAQTGIAKEQYQKLDNTFEFGKTIKKTSALKNYSKSYLTYNSKYSFYKYYRDSKKNVGLSLKPKYLFLREFSKYLNNLK